MVPRMRLLQVYDGRTPIAWQTERHSDGGPSISHWHLTGDAIGHWHPGPITGARLSYDVLSDTMPGEDLPLTMPPVTVCGG
jgi:hypothetical protein